MVSSYYIYVDALQTTQLNDMTSENHISQLSFLFWLLLLHATGKKKKPYGIHKSHTISKWIKTQLEGNGSTRFRVA
jgi:hypothetical protein